MCGSGPSGKTQVFPPGFSFPTPPIYFCGSFHISPCWGGKKKWWRSGSFSGQFWANFQKCDLMQLQSWLAEKNTDANDATTRFLPHAEGAQSQRVWLDNCSKSRLPLQHGICEGSTAGQWFFWGKWVTSSPWSFAVQTRKHKPLLRNMHRCAVLDALL